MRMRIREPVICCHHELTVEVGEPLGEQRVDPAQRCLEVTAKRSAYVTEFVDGRKNREDDLATLQAAAAELACRAVVGLSPQVREVSESPDQVAAELALLRKILRDRARGGPRMLRKHGDDSRVCLHPTCGRPDVASHPAVPSTSESAVEPPNSGNVRPARR